MGNIIRPAKSIIQIQKFNINSMKWSDDVLSVAFDVEKEPFGEGSFRAAFKAKSTHKDFVQNVGCEKVS